MPAFWDKLIGRQPAPSFVRDLTAALRARGFKVGAESANCLLLDGEHRFMLDRFQQQWDNSADRAAVVAHAVAFAEETRRHLGAPSGSPLERLVPMVRSRITWELMPLRVRARMGTKLRADGLNIRMPYEPLGEIFGVGLVQDLPESRLNVSTQDLEKWGIRFEEAMARALSNFTTRMGRLPEVKDERIVIQGGEGYLPDFLLLPEFQHRLDGLRGAPVAFIPSSSRLLVGGSEDLATMAAMLQDADQTMRAGQDSLRSTPLILQNGQWQPWLPGRPHPLAEPLGVLWRQCRGTDVEEQNECFQALRQAAGSDKASALLQGTGPSDATLASQNLIKTKQTGDLLTLCTWQKGVKTLLPRTDVIVLERDGQQAVVPFDVLTGFMQKVDGLYPERFVTETFPTDEQLAALKTAP